MHRSCPLVNIIENINHGQVCPCAGTTPQRTPSHRGVGSRLRGFLGCRKTKLHLDQFSSWSWPTLIQSMQQWTAAMCCILCHTWQRGRIITVDLFHKSHESRRSRARDTAVWIQLPYCTAWSTWSFSLRKISRSASWPTSNAFVTNSNGGCGWQQPTGRFKAQAQWFIFLAINASCCITSVTLTYCFP